MGMSAPVDAGLDAAKVPCQQHKTPGQGRVVGFAASPPDAFNKKGGRISASDRAGGSCTEVAATSPSPDKIQTRKRKRKHSLPTADPRSPTVTTPNILHRMPSGAVVSVSDEQPRDPGSSDVQGADENGGLSAPSSPALDWSAPELPASPVATQHRPAWEELRAAEEERANDDAYWEHIVLEEGDVLFCSSPLVQPPDVVRTATFCGQEMDRGRVEVAAASAIAKSLVPLEMAPPAASGQIAEGRSARRNAAKRR